MCLFPLGDPPVGVRLHAVDVRTECGRGDSVRRKVVPKHLRQVFVLDSPAAIRRGGQSQQRGEQRGRRDPQNSSLMPSCPYRGKFDWRTTVRSMVPNSGLVGLFSYCRSS